MFTEYEKRRMLTLSGEGMSAPKNSQILQVEGVLASRRGIFKFITRYDKTQMICLLVI